MSHFNIFLGHKYLERAGAQLLTKFATADANNRKMMEEICISLSKFEERLKGHADWEKHFIFKLLPGKTVSREENFHNHLDAEMDFIQQELIALQSSSNKNLHQIYLRFRKFYSELLSHLYDEEVDIIKMLYERFSEQELRQIDYDIYKSMSSTDILAMVSELFPACNFDEKLAVLEDLKSANPSALMDAWPKMKHFFSEEEMNKSLQSIFSQ